MLCMDMKSVEYDCARDSFFYSWDYYNCVELDTFIEEIVVRFNIRSEDGTLRWLFFFKWR